MVREKTFRRAKMSDESGELKKLVLHNDDFNHFDFVVHALVDVCGHDPEQAEQCALIAHYKGMCDVKEGTYKEMIHFHKELSLRNLTVSIE
jgi:ATP-dependent Clp protease adaptor protein ClpS